MAQLWLTRVRCVKPSSVLWPSVSTSTAVWPCLTPRQAHTECVGVVAFMKPGVRVCACAAPCIVNLVFTTSTAGSRQCVACSAPITFVSTSNTDGHASARAGAAALVLIKGVTFELLVAPTPTVAAQLAAFFNMKTDSLKLIHKYVAADDVGGGV